MRVLATCQPAHGHFRPLVPLLTALVSAGHAVEVATSGAFADVVRAEGLAVRAVGPDWLESRPEDTWPDLAGDATTADGISRRLGDAFQRAARATLPDLLGLVEDVRPDVVVHESDEFLAPLIAERVGVMWVGVGISLQQPRPGPNPAWDAARASLGLPPDPQQADLWPHLYLDPVPGALQSVPTTDLVPAARPMRPVTAAGGGGESGTTRPLVLVTLGTIFSRVRGLLRSMVEGVEELDVDVLVATGQLGVDIGQVSDRVRVVSLLPFREVLPRTAAVVHHGGSGTSLAVLAAGLPSVVVPLASDQLRNARTLVDAGVAIALDHTDLTPQLIAEATRRTLSSPDLKGASPRLAAAIAAMPDPQTAVSWIESLVEDAAGG